MEATTKIDNKKIDSAGRSNSKRTRISQKVIPRLPLKEVVKLVQALNDSFAGKPVSPHQLAIAVNISPTSSRWQDICGASIAYGLTIGGYGADKISLTDLGKRVVAPTSDNDDKAALIEAALLPEIQNKFFNQYDKNKFPQEIIAKNVLQEMGVPRERVDAALQIIMEDGEFVGIILNTKTGPYVALENIVKQQNGDNGNTPILTASDTVTPVLADSSIPQISPSTKLDKEIVPNRRVFIGHGKNKELLSQLKAILEFGKFDPTIATEEEATAKPIPDKVLESMRSCFAGILHISSEQELIDPTGNRHDKLNENVLIEIGAAMALYDKNFILLVEKGVQLPSNLQGLYRCEYKGEKLDGDATMKLLKAFNNFKQIN